MQQRRIWIIDFLRGFAVVAMVVYHIFFDLKVFGIYEGFEPARPLWRVLGGLVAALFFFLVGFCLQLSYNRVLTTTTRVQRARKYLWRAAKLFLWGCLITLVTYFTVSDLFVRFGALHFIGLSVALGYVFLEVVPRDDRNKILAVLVPTIVGGGLVLNSLRAPFSWLVWLGFPPRNFQTLDYFPLFPWFGAVLVGFWAYRRIAPGSPGLLDNIWTGDPPLWAALFCAAGKRALPIYLLHQPLVIFFLVFIFPRTGLGPQFSL